MPRSFAAAACLLLACTAADRRADLPFDARPAMRAVLADARRIAGVLDDGPLAEAVPAARRLATLRIARGREGVDPRFEAAEELLRARASSLVDELDARDRTGAARAFEQVLRQCDACHESFRPGGARGLPVER